MIRSKKLALVASLALASVLNARNVVADWNAIASTTVIANGGKVPGASTVWLAYSSLPTLPSTPPQWPRRIAFWSTISRSNRRH
jgi:hypothetical protein